MTVPPRRKLGLALAGGGFRASLFHLGVLRRLAELDVLRKVEVLSTVSGGSIVGALYALLLKRELDRARDGNLTREKYLQITEELDATLVRGIQKNLRLRLFLNPFGILRILTTEHTLGRRMARLYERYLYRDVVAQLKRRGKREGWWARFWPGRIRLRDIRIHPGGTGELPGGIEEYNRSQVAAGRSAVTGLVLNATSLNSGQRFWFSSAEVGDTRLGQFRHSELDVLLDRKRLLQGLSDHEIAAVELDPDGAHIGLAGSRDRRSTVALALWWRDGDYDVAPAGWEDLFRGTGLPGRLPYAELGLLRQAKLPAWFIRVGVADDRSDPADASAAILAQSTARTNDALDAMDASNAYGTDKADRLEVPGIESDLPEVPETVIDPEAAPRRVTGGCGADEHWDRLLGAVRNIDEPLGNAMEAYAGEDHRRRADVADFILELFWLRSAERVSVRIKRDWDRLTLGDAVGASACFPPVFPPFGVLGIYDDAHVARLGLTDGGVYDNIGITALLDENCTDIIASDTSGLFHVQDRVATGRVGMSMRITSVLTNALAGVQRNGLAERRRVSRAIDESLPDPSARDAAQRELAAFGAARELGNLAFFHIDSPPVTPPGPPPIEPGIPGHELAGIRTDLDSFGDVEIAALVDHGYDTADRYVRTHMEDYRRPQWDREKPTPPKPVVDGERAARIVRVGRSRFFRAPRLGAPVSIAFQVVAIGAVLAATWFSDLSIAGASGAAAGWIGSALVSAIPEFLRGWITTPRSLAIGLVAVIAYLAVSRAAGVDLVALARKRSVVLARRLATTFKWGRSLAGNLLWLIGLLPAVIAGLSAVFALIALTFFDGPFLAKTRIRRRDPAV